jgi:threonine aldolase
LGLEIAFPVQGNEVFVRMPDEVHAALQAAGHAYYPVWDPAERLYRLVASFDTQPADVAALLADARRAIIR